MATMSPPFFQLSFTYQPMTCDSYNPCNCAKCQRTRIFSNRSSHKYNMFNSSDQKVNADSPQASLTIQPAGYRTLWHIISNSQTPVSMSQQREGGSVPVNLSHGSSREAKLTKRRLLQRGWLTLAAKLATLIRPQLMERVDLISTRTLLARTRRNWCMKCIRDETKVKAKCSWL